MITHDDVVAAVERADLPPDALDGLQLDPWGDEDYVFWRSPGRPQRGYLVAPSGGALVAVELRCGPRSALSRRSGMCNLCLTVHPPGEVALWTNSPRGRHQHSTGDWVCRDFDCKERITGRSPLGETISPEARRERMLVRLERLVTRYAAAAADR